MSESRPPEGLTNGSSTPPDGVSRALSRFLDGLPLLAWMIRADGRLAYVNDAWVEFSGQTREALLETGIADQVLPEERSAIGRILSDALRRETSFETEFQLKRYDGQHRWLTCFASPFCDSLGEFAGLIGICMDLTERRQREEQLAFMATHDSLTGLPNRRLFEGTLGRAVERARRGTPSALLMLDIDNFKRYNDARGHLDGDQALVNFALLVQRHVRAGDLIARIGGDEFAVLFEQTTIPEAVEISERMRAAAYQEEFVSGARNHELGMSAGLVPIDGTLPPRGAFDLADAAMYEAKEGGRNRVEVMRPSDAEEDHDTERLAGRIREALTDQRFMLYYQPVIRLDGGGVAYYESLVRMIGPSGAIMMPADFLPTVERLGLMPRLTRLVVGMALNALRANEAAKVSVNLAGGDLADDSLPRFVDEELRRLEVDPSRLTFEMSEGAVMGNLANARVWMDRLGRLGCRFVLDDFGAGVGLFGLLRELPFDQVKLDGSIIAALASDEQNRTFVEAVRALIESQDREAVASWVEDEDLLRRVRQAGFSLGQGYHLHTPSPDLDMLVRHYGAS